MFCLLFVVFFFKQKTAYEMRISDWSSDVCSSDLYRPRRLSSVVHRHKKWPSDIVRRRHCPGGSAVSDRARRQKRSSAACRSWSWPGHTQSGSLRRVQSVRYRRSCSRPYQPSRRHSQRRSEEHTSELRSLMRISYAVFCLKKKKKKEIDLERTERVKTHINNK